MFIGREKELALLQQDYAVNKMEGVPVRCYAIELSNAWCEGKITGAQMKETLLKSHMEMARRVK